MMRSRLLLVVFFCTTVGSTAQIAKDLAVRAWTTISATKKPWIMLHWNVDPYAKSYSIWRKLKTDVAFPTDPVASLDSTAVVWKDTSASIGTGYEYRIFKHCMKQVGIDTTTKKPIISVYDAAGYVYAGINVPSIERGRVLLLVDSTLSTWLTGSLDVLRTDLENEGWTVTQRTAPRAEAFSPTAVAATRAIVAEEYNAAPRNLTTVFIIGHVAVPYSGNMNPDGHPDHLGAWPADVYYADPSASYTDNSVNRTGVRVAQVNVPGDGKFDQSVIPSLPKLAVGRVDFFDMPLFQRTELEMLVAYLKKDHEFRTGAVSVKGGGVIDNNFDGYPEGFASSGWRAIAPFVGDSSVKDGDFFGTLGGATTYLWAYGCGGGTDTSAGGVGGTSQFVSKPVNAVFTMLFGSYFGDWNTTNNFLRAPLASSPRALTCVWSGRPHWYLHHMALGETIGYSTIISQANAPVVGNQLGTYAPHVYYTDKGASMVSSGDNLVHIALMGDPTLRASMSVIPQPAQLTASTVYPNKVRLTWLAPAGGADAYAVYRVRNGSTRLLTPKLITTTSYTDSLSFEGELTYLVRSCKLRASASGTYYDAGKAAVVRVTTTGVQGDDGVAATTLTIAPNPVSSHAVITVDDPEGTSATVSVHDITGRMLASWTIDAMAPGTASLVWNTEDVAPGRYIVRCLARGIVRTTTVAVVR